MCLLFHCCEFFDCIKPERFAFLILAAVFCIDHECSHMFDCVSHTFNIPCASTAHSVTVVMIVAVIGYWPYLFSVRALLIQHLLSQPSHLLLYTIYLYYTFCLSSDSIKRVTHIQTLRLPFFYHNLFYLYRLYGNMMALYRS